MFLKEKDRTDCYQRLFDSDDGKAVLEELEAKYHIHRPTFVEQDVNTTLIHEGQRSVILYIKHFLQKKDNRAQQTIAT